MKLLKNILFLTFFITYGVFSQSSSDNYVFQENFNSKGSWPTGSNEFRSLNVYNGRYYFEHKRNEKFWRVSTTSFNLDTSKDFELETSIQKISGVESSGISFLYDFKDANNYKEFGYTSSGYFRVAKSVGGTYSNQKSWTSSSKVKKGNFGVNTLKISKTGNTITFYINGSNVYSQDFTSFVGKQMAICIYRNQKISIDYLKVKQKSSSSYNNNNNNNNNNKKYSKSNTIVYDSFYSNRNNWAVSNGEQAKLEIKSSKYYFEYTGNKGWTTTKSFDFDTTRDFKVEASFQKVSGIKNNGFGLVFGREDTKNQHQFLINALGSYSIDKYENGSLNTLVNWTRNSSIKKENYSVNVLKIEKRGNNFYYYVNNSLVYTAYDVKVYGKRYGFSIFEPQKIAIDYISISYLDSGSNYNDDKDIDNSRDKLLFSDNFDSSNPNQWTERNDQDTHFRLSNGKYYIKHKRKDKGWSTNINKYFDSSQDFEMVTKIDKVSGVTNNAYGLMWGLEGGNSFRFYIASSGYYKIVRTINSKEEVIVKWTKSSAVNQNNGASNILKVRKEDNYYKFYINNRYVTKTDFESFHGNRIGYVVYNDQEIAVDYLKIYSLKSDGGTKKYVSNKTLSLPLNEQFTFNTNGWNLEDSDDYSAAIVKGKFLLHKKQKGGIFVSRSININTAKDFVIETSMARTSNSENGLYGFTFGRKNSSNEYSFLLSGNGSYMYRKFDNDVYKKIIPFTQTSAIKTGLNQYNSIKIVKSGSLLRFYINDQYVNEAPFEGFFGDKFGYVIYYDKEIAVDYLNVKYQTESFNNPPVVVITSPNVEVKRGFKIVEAKRIQVTGNATDADGIFEITVNGVEANVSENGNFTANVPLKYGKNDLVVKATDMKQASSTKTFTIKRKSASLENTIITKNDPKNKIDVGFGKYYALIIGVSDYEDKSIVDLNGEPTKDAQALADVLISKYGFSTANVTVLKNPTDSQINRSFYQLRKKVGKSDNLLIFYAGHGNYDEASERGYWMPSNANMEFEDNIILNTTIVSHIKAINSKHTLLIADACFSGSIFKSRSYVQEEKNAKRKYSLTSRKAITSGTLKTVPNKSVFIKYLLKRLHENTDPYLSTRKLFDRIEEPVMNNSANTPQRGVIHGSGDEGGDFIFIKKI